MTNIKVTGKCAWAKVQPGNFDEYKGVKSWRLNFYPNKEAFQILKEAKIQTKLKEDDGEKSGVTGSFYNFRRPLLGLVGGVERKRKPAVITHNGEPFSGEIGNGSLIELTLDVYNTSMGVGTRIKEVNVLELIEYSGSSFKDEFEPEVVESDEIPFKSTPEKKGSTKIDW